MSLAVHALPGKGRAVLATTNIAAGAMIHQCIPMAQVLKSEPVPVCPICCSPSPGGALHPACASAHADGGGALLDRVRCRRRDRAQVLVDAG
jgi:hypothetical protein